MTFVDILCRLSLATIIGGAIGYEREFKNRPAGFKTHILVCIGAAIVSLIQVHIADNVINIVKANPEMSNIFNVDFARLGAQVITGVGFLGAGTIIHAKGAIRGLTTAASLWVVACIGLAAGMGYYTISILGGIFIVITLVILQKFESKFITKANMKKIEIHYIDKNNGLSIIDNIFAEQSIEIKSIEFINVDDKDFYGSKEKQWILRYTISIPKNIDINEMLNRLSVNKNIKKIIEMD